MGEADSRYRQIFERANDAILLLDVERDAILDANAKACQVLEYPRNELLALPISATHPDDVAKMREFVGSVLERGSGWTNELTCVARSGRRVPAEISASVFETDGRTCLLALIRDLSELQRQHERLLERSAGLQQVADQRTVQLREFEERRLVLLELNNAIIAGANRESLLRAIIGALRGVRFHRASLTVADPTRGVSTVIAVATEPGDATLLSLVPVGAQVPYRGTVVERVLDERRPVVVRDMSQQVVGHERVLIDGGIRSAISAPLLGTSGAIGTVNIGSLAPEQHSVDDAEWLTEIGIPVALALEGMLANETIERRTAQLRASEDRHRVLLDVNNAIIGSLDHESLFAAIAGTLRTVLRFDRADLTLADMSRGTSTVRALVDGAADSTILSVVPVGAEFTHRGTPIGRALEERRPIAIRDWSQEPAVDPLSALVEYGIRSAIIAPLLTKRGPIGTVDVYGLAPDQYSDDDAEFLTEVGAQLALAVENARAHEEIVRLAAELEREAVYLREEISVQFPYQDIVGQSPAIRNVVQALERVAPTDATVLITGETGTGKELVARAIHHVSPRRAKPIVKVNCAALPPGLIESELFGHERGAFSGALARRIGRFELAHGGTIFLDEIGDLPMDLQAKLLRVLQDGEFERVGGTATIKVSARVIAATNLDLDTAMREGRFREDLYFRLSVFPIRVPPLRERQEDIPLLVRHLAIKCSTKLGTRIESIPSAAMDALCGYSWPGNVRELENVIERAVILSRGARLELDDWMLRPPVVAPDTGSSTLEDVERRHIRDMLERTGWRVSGKSGAAKLLGLKPTTLEARMRKLGLTRPG